MDKLTSRERLIRTFKGEEVDHIPTYDILHNIPLIEYATGEKINPKNAEDLLCKAANKYLDLIRHFAVPDYEGEKIVREDDGFAYRYEWWTGHIIDKPVYRTVEDAAKKIEEDTEKIIKSTSEKKLCSALNNHVNLFYEKFEYFEEVREEYKRINEKLGGTVMLGPEMTMPVPIAMFRHGLDWWTYVYHDYPDIALRYIDASYEYELAFIDAYNDLEIMPFVCSAGSIGMDDRLLFSKEFFKEIVIPREQKIFDKFKEHNKYIVAFLDGYKLPVIRDFIDAGIDAVDPFEPYCSMDVKKFREEYPEKVICQPVDCTQLLPFGTVEAVKAVTLKAIKDSGERKILMGSTSEIHPNIKIENAVAMYETAQNYFL
ncbi:MAG: uroporphyrinogen decarboxylase family protein [Candidatus Humimicrobiaceae bacterium]